MKIEINGTVWELKFNILFIRRMDLMHTVKQSGLELGFGISLAILQLQLNNPVMAFDVLKSALGSKVKDEEIEAYLEDENTDIEELCSGLLKELETQPLTKGTFRKLGGVNTEN